MFSRKFYPQIIAFTFSFLLLGMGSVLAQKVWTLEECVLYALENNIQIKQSRLQTETAEINLLQSKMDFAPSLNANASIGNNWGRSIGASNTYETNTATNNSFNLSSSIELFGGMKKWNTLKKNEIDYKASKYISEEMENNIALALTGGYLQILFNHEMLRIAEKQIEVTKQQISRTEKLVEAGSLPSGDLLEIQAQGATEESNLIMARNAVDLSYLDLKQMMDIPSHEELEIDFPKMEISKELQIIPSEQVYANAVEIMPEIKSSEMNVQSAEKAIQIAKGYLYPTLSLSGGIGTNYYSSQKETLFDSNNFPYQGNTIPYLDQIDGNTGEYITLSLSIPIFNGYAARSNVNRSKVQSISRNFDLELRKNELRKNIEQKYHDAIAAYKTYNANRITVESLAESFKYTEEKFAVGMLTSLDYSLAKMRLTQAESDLLRAKYDYIFKTKILDFYMGIPLSL